MNKTKNAIVLCSGGIDSVTTAYYVKKSLKYQNLIILFFDYGQKSIRKERIFSKKTAEKLNGKFIEIKLKELGKISNSLINKKNKFKTLQKKDLKDTKKENKKWYVPARNVIFLSYALSIAESFMLKHKMKYDIFVGFKNEGEEHYPDTTPEFLKSINKLAEISCLKKFKIMAPFIKKDKEDIILLGKGLGINFKETFSCYVGKEKHCGHCLACKLRQQGFYWAGLPDPTEYSY